LKSNDIELKNLVFHPVPLIGGDLAFCDAMKFQAEEIAKIFGVSLQQIGLMDMGGKN
jgi:hypothetical protein